LHFVRSNSGRGKGKVKRERGREKEREGERRREREGARLLHPTSNYIFKIIRIRFLHFNLQEAMLATG